MRAAQRRKGKACAELHALDSGHAEQDGGQTALHAVEHRAADACREADGRAFDDAADAVTSLARRRDGFAHLLAARIADDGKLLASKRACQLTFVSNARNGGDAAHKRDSFARENLQADAARDAQRCGQAAGKVSAARAVLIAAVFDLGGVVRVTGARRDSKIRVILRAGVRIADDGRERRAAGIAVHKAGEDLRRVGLLARRRPDVFARRAAIQKALEFVQINFLARGDALDRHADGRGMRLAEDGQMQIFAVGAAHKPSPFKLPKSSQKRG